MSSAILSIDAGTTLIKSVVFDRAGRELASAARVTRIYAPAAGFAEQDMNEVWAAVRESAAQATAEAGVQIAAVAVTAQGDGAWFVDDNGEPAGPAYLWSDARSADIVDRWAGNGTLERAFRINGSLGNLGLPNAIAAALLADDPRALDRVSRILTCGSWIFSKLTGAEVLHSSEASAPWVDMRTGLYSDELLDLYGLHGRDRLLPPQVSSARSRMPLLGSTADELGLPPGTPVVLAPYDVASTAAGSGALETGNAFCILGTTLCTGTVTASPDLDGPATGLTLRLGDESDGFLRVFPSLTGTGALSWTAEMLGLSGAADVTELAASSSPGAAGLMMWPYLSPAGERTPLLDPSLRGMITGATVEHTRADLARAAVEGLGHIVRECLSAADQDADVICLSGGGAASDLWCSTVADITGTPARRTTDTQVGAKGAMLYAEVALREYDSLAEAAAALVHPGATFSPEPRNAELHELNHERFLAQRAGARVAR